MYCTQDHGVSVDVVKEPSGKILIEGPPAGVIAAQAELGGTVFKLQDETTIEVAIEQRLHSLIIGKSGAGINEVRTVLLHSCEIITQQGSQLVTCAFLVRIVFDRSVR